MDGSNKVIFGAIAAMLGAIAVAFVFVNAVIIYDNTPEKELKKSNSKLLMKGLRSR